MTKSRDQDIYYFIAGLSANRRARHYLAEKVKANFDAVRLLLAPYEN